MIYSFDGISPTIDPGAYVCREATIIGDVTVAEDATVWPGAVLRGDLNPVTVGQGSHIEDNCVFHQGEVGERVIVGHGAILNVASVSDNVLIGMNATLNRDVRIAERCVIAPNAVVPEGRHIPSETLVHGVPARLTPFEETDHDFDSIFARYSPETYIELAERNDGLFERE